MGRKRKDSQTAWMPPRVYMGRSAYEYHPKAGGAIRLCDKESSQSQVWAAWEKLINEIPNHSILSSLVDYFFKSPDFFELAKETQKDYKIFQKNYCGFWTDAS